MCFFLFCFHQFTQQTQLHQHGYAKSAKEAVLLGQRALDEGKIYFVAGIGLRRRLRFRNNRSFWRWKGSEYWERESYISDYKLKSFEMYA